MAGLPDEPAVRSPTSVTFGSGRIAAMKLSLLLAHCRPINSWTAPVYCHGPRGLKTRGIAGPKSVCDGPLRSLT